MIRPSLLFAVGIVLALVIPASSDDAGRNELRAGFPISSFTSNSSSDARIATTVFLKHVFASAQIPYEGQGIRNGGRISDRIETRIDRFLCHQL